MEDILIVHAWCKNSSLLTDMYWHQMNNGKTKLDNKIPAGVARIANQIKCIHTREKNTKCWMEGRGKRLVK